MSKKLQMNQVVLPNKADDMQRKMMQSIHEIEHRTDKLKNFLAEKSLIDNICFWGAAAKGVMCCKFFDPNNQFIDCVVDINLNKNCTFIPLTGHEIVLPEKLAERTIKIIIVLNGNYYAEIIEMAQKINPIMSVYNLETLWCI